MRRNPAKGHWSPCGAILLAVQYYCRLPLSYPDMSDLLAQREAKAAGLRLYRTYNQTA